MIKEVSYMHVQKCLKYLLFCAGILFCQTHLSAQGTTASHIITLNLSNAIELTFSQGSSGVGFTFNNTATFQNGIVSANAATLQIKSNRGFNVSVKTSASNFTSSAATVMPVNNILFVKESGQANYLNLSTSDQTLISGQTLGTKTFGVTYKATPGFNHDGGTYTVNVIYTATQQ
jgi:hypothetical protein